MPLLKPLLYTMTPLQLYYAGDYLASSLGRSDPLATTETRLLWKSRPVPQSNSTPKSKKTESKIENEFALERDVEPRPLRDRIGKYDAEPFQMSEGARAEGWTGVSRGYPRKVTLTALHGFLKESVYNDQPLWRFCVQPAVGLIAVLTVTLAVLPSSTTRRVRSRAMPRRSSTPTPYL